MMLMGRNVDLPTPESPQAKFWAWVIGIVVATLGAWLFIDDRFMRRAEALEMRAEYTTQLAQLNAAQRAQAEAINQNTEWLIDSQTKRSIESKLFELEQIDPRMLRPQDRALYEKLKRDRAELVRLWNQRGRPLR